MMKWWGAALVVACVAFLAISRAQTPSTTTGFDCTGVVDSTASLQAAINAMPDTGTIYFPLGCKVKLGTGLTSGQCGITITSRVGVQFKSDVLIGNFGGGLTPTFYWYGSGGTVFCVNSTDHPRFIGVAFQVAGGGNMDSCITFDGNPAGGHIGTNGVVDYVVCNNGSNNNPNFVGISISPTATSNHENYEISHLYLNCSNSQNPSYGIGLRNGASQNALQQTFRRITYNRCNTGIYIAGGNAEMDHINGGQSDTGIYIASFTSEQSSISWYEAEGDRRGIDAAGPLLMVTNSRASNGNQYADGFFRFGGNVNIQNTFVEFAAPVGAVLVGKQPNSNPTITGINNVWRQTYTALGYPLIQEPPPTSINDSTNGGSPAQFVFGCWNYAWSCVQVSNIVPHIGGAALDVHSTNFYGDWTTPVMGIKITNGLDVIGSYTGIYVAPMLGRAPLGSVPLTIGSMPFSFLPSCVGWTGSLAAVSNGAAASWGASVSAGAAGPPSFLGYCDGVNWTLTGQ